jgi:two-component system sensor histidine kinase KdpD
MNLKRTEHVVLALVALVSLLILLSTIAFPHKGWVAVDRYTLLAVLWVGVIARYRGLRAGVASAVGAFLLLGFISNPRGLLPGSGGDLYIDLTIFLLVAILGGAQTGILREREEIARESERTTALVNRIVGRMVPISTTPHLVEAVLHDLGEASGAKFVLVLCPDADGHLVPMRKEAASWLEQFPGALVVSRYAFDRQIAVGSPKRTRPFESHGIPLPFEPAPEGDGQGTGADLAIPLVSGTSNEGVLYLSPRNDGETYSMRDAEVAVLVAGFLALALERQRLEKAVARMEALEESDRMKSSLLSSVSHQLRSPLAAVTTTITGLIAGGANLADADVREGLESASEDLRTLERRIRELLDVARLEASSWIPRMEWNDIADLCATARSELQPGLRSRVSCAVPPSTPLGRFDFVQMSRALHHLMENAISYSPPESEVLVGADIDEGHLALWVEDRGPGVPASERSAIFEKLYRGAAAERFPEGSGLGLAVAAEIVRQHHGVIRVEDVDPHGARFVIDIPQDDDGGAR